MAGLALGLVFPYRLDYAAHATAGAAAVFLLVGIGSWAGWGPWVGVAGLGVVFVGGLLGEATVFGPRIDLLDVLVGAIGAVWAAALVVRFPPVRGAWWVTCVVGVAGLGAAGWIRYALVANNPG